MNVAMQAEVNGKTHGLSQDVLVTVATAHQVVRGMLQTRGERLLDILNRSQSSFLRIERAAVLEHLNGDGIGMELPHAIVRKSEICLAIPNEVAGRPLEKILCAYSAKQSHKAFIAALGYLIEGQIHLRRCSDEVAVLTRELGEFLPVTNAKVTCVQEAFQPCDCPITIVNASAISLFSLMPIRLQDQND
jgi:hypothetical protein